MLPIRDDLPTRAAPLAVVGLIAVNAVVFGYEVSLAWRGELEEFIEAWGLVPRELLRAAGDPGATRQVAWLTPLSSLFLHGGLLHLAGNMLYLWIFGNDVEDLLGHGRFLLFYFACGLAAAALHTASAPASYAPTVGASGAVSGVLGAYAVAYPTGRLRLVWPDVRVPAALFLGVWIALQILSGLGSLGAEDERAGVAWWAHVGGFATGIALGRSMRAHPPTRSRLRI